VFLIGEQGLRFDSAFVPAHNPAMEIRLVIDEEIARRAEEKAKAVGISLEQAISTYVWRIAEGTETLQNELLPNGTPRRRTLREQTYR
jgi:hypothetical protein